VGQQGYKLSREAFDIFFSCRTWFDLLCHKLRDALREIAVFGSKEGKLRN
jgi:hypothetical protein